MSDVGNFKLEDIVWELSDNDDHIVPFSGDQKFGYALKSDNYNRPKNELKGAEIKADCGIATGNVTRNKGEANITIVKEKMLEENPWTHSSSKGFPVSLDGDVKRNNVCPVPNEEGIRTPCLRSDVVKSADSELFVDDPVLGNREFAADNVLKPQLPNEASRSENDLAFLGNDFADKGSDDLLFYGWPELENFEDVDNMFRDCDPTFCLDMNNGDDLSWFSSSHMIEGSNDALKSGFDFSGCNPSGLNCDTEHQERDDAYGQKNDGMVVNETQKKLKPATIEKDPNTSLPDTRSTVMGSFTNESGATSDICTQSLSQVNSLKHKSPEGKRKSCATENGVSVIHFDKLHDLGEANHLLNSQHCLSPENHQKQEIIHRPCLQTQKPMIKPVNHPLEHVLPNSTPSVVNSELRVLSSISPRGSSNASNQTKSMENSHDISRKNPTSSENKKKGKLHQRRSSKHAEKSTSRLQRVDSNLLYGKKANHGGKSEPECQSEVDGCDISFARDRDASTIQDSSCTSSVLDEIAIDASSLKQLLHVMGQLDIRTKLCIRDSLYRLARSAAHRHKGDNQSSGRGDNNDANGAVLPGTNKSNAFIDMETDTNPIDRSIAHLLFHRPSDPSASAAPVDAMAAKPPIMVEVPNPLAAEKLVGQNETSFANEGAIEQRN